MALAVLVKGGMGFDAAYELVRRKVPTMQINVELLDSVREIYG